MTTNVRRYPRTMQEAFGPHVDNRLLPMDTPRETPLGAKILYTVAVVALIAWAAILTS